MPTDLRHKYVSAFGFEQVEVIELIQNVSELSLISPGFSRLPRDWFSVVFLRDKSQIKISVGSF
jgi:hypothetical protein